MELAFTLRKSDPLRPVDRPSRLVRKHQIGRKDSSTFWRAHGLHLTLGLGFDLQASKIPIDMDCVSSRSVASVLRRLDYEDDVELIRLCINGSASHFSGSARNSCVVLSHPHSDTFLSNLFHSFRFYLRESSLFLIFSIAIASEIVLDSCTCFNACIQASFLKPDSALFPFLTASTIDWSNARSISSVHTSLTIMPLNKALIQPSWC